MACLVSGLYLAVKNKKTLHCRVRVTASSASFREDVPKHTRSYRGIGSQSRPLMGWRVDWLLGRVGGERFDALTD